MKRTLRRHNGKRTIHTTNGIKTRSTPVFLKHLEVFTPREDGYNEELAEAMWEQIYRQPKLWDQGSWRRIIFDVDDAQAMIDDLDERGIDDDSSAEEVFRTLADSLASNGDAPVCGTAMCAAGWVGELSGVDMVVDLDMMRWAKEAGHGPDYFDEIAEYVMIPVAMVTARQTAIAESQRTEQAANRLPMLHDGDLGVSIEHYFEEDYDEILRRLEERGFTPESHRIAPVAQWALWQLGMRGLQVLDIQMFSAGNTLGKIRAHLDCYAKHGPTAHQPLAFDEPTYVQPYLPQKRVKTDG